MGGIVRGLEASNLRGVRREASISDAHQGNYQVDLIIILYRRVEREIYQSGVVGGEILQDSKSINLMMNIHSTHDIS